MVEKYSHTEATDGKKPKTTEHSRLKDLPTAPGYEWLHEMDKRDDIIRIYVDERHDTMYMHQEGLSAVAKIVISIVMNYVTAGAFSLLSAVMTNLVINTLEARGNLAEGTKRTLSKEGLKSIGRSYVGKLIIGGDFGAADGAGWLANLQNAFMESLNTTLSDYLGRGIVDGDWRVNARRIGLDLLTNTAARFGAKQIGGWRQGTIFDGDAFSYSHSI